MDKFRVSVPQVLFAIMIGGIAMLMGLSTGVNKPEQELDTEEVTKMSLSKYFDVEEINTIMDAGKRNNLNPEQIVILFAIRKAENGGHGREFGVMHPRALDTDLDTQAGWAAATIYKNYYRWENAGKPTDFITYLGNVYCPVGAENDPSGLNNHWIGNVKNWVDKIRD